MKSIAFLLFILIVAPFSAQKTTISTDSVLLRSSYPTAETLFNPSVDYPNEVYESCEALFYSPFVSREYDFGVSKLQVEDKEDWIVFVDSTRTDTAFYIFHEGKTTQFKKWYRNGKIMQTGELTIVTKDNIRYDLSEVGGNNRDYWVSWMGSVYIGLPIATGKWKNFYENGQLASKGEHQAIITASINPPILDPETFEKLFYIVIPDYNYSQKNGKWIYYNEEGEQILIEHYENGKVTDFSCTP